MFESYVILDTTKTYERPSMLTPAFESYVILDTTKTGNGSSSVGSPFESYVILHYIKILCMSNNLEV